MAHDHLKKPKPPAPTASTPPQGRRVLFRLLAVLLIPLLFLGLLEVTLRLADYGYPTAFFLPASHQGQKVWIQNNRFGWRFFGPDVARWPYPLLIPQSKATNTVRILVMGESAARGEPQPDFGLSRMLQAMLSMQYPGTRFEVVNTAMTAINSHAILPIARDCARADGDVWVISMGNNEVVGPFGAGTVFGSASSPLPVIRAGLTLKRTRTGQLLDALGRSAGNSEPDDGLWGGMTLFLDRQVRSDDPRMDRVYHNFERNLADILRTGRAAGVPIVLGTVAVNLTDCPPFASAHRPDLSTTDLAEWERLYQLGMAAQDAGALEEAAAHFAGAARIDDTFAELRFRQGEVALQREQNDEADAQFRAARDLDTLRFRCDTTLNGMIRRAAAEFAGGPVLLADAEDAFRKHRPEGLSDDLFFEHVHFTFKGNYLLARSIAEQLVTVLPGWVEARPIDGAPWPSLADCAAWLGYTDWHRAAALNSVLTTLADPPFTAQLDHAARMRQLEAELVRLSAARQPAGIERSLQACDAALKSSPDDPVLYKQLATLKKASGDLPGAAAAARRQVELLPNDADGWALLGSILAQQQEPGQAVAALRHAFETGPRGVQAMLDLADALAALGRQDEAVAEYRSILERKPGCVAAWLRLGQLSDTMGNRAQAEECFQQALSHRSQRLPELMELAAFFRARGAFKTAAEIGEDALRLNPSDAQLHLWTGRDLASLGRFDDAAPHSAEAVRLAPGLVEARLLHGIVLWKQGRTPEAMAEFENALRLQPDSVDARLNLGMALAQQGRNAEALQHFETVLKLDPTNALALRYVEALKDTHSRGATGN